MTAPINAVFDTPEDASAAVATLRRDGVPRQAITIRSSEPLHFEFFKSDEARSRISGFAIAGGFLGAACAILLTVLTSRRVDLVTGGMPIVTPWAFGIVTFELTALGAILATLARMIHEARLVRRILPQEYDEAVACGRVVVTVACSDEAHTTTAKKLLTDWIKREK